MSIRVDLPFLLTTYFSTNPHLLPVTFFTSPEFAGMNVVFSVPSCDVTFIRFLYVSVQVSQEVSPQTRRVTEQN